MHTIYTHIHIVYNVYTYIYIYVHIHLPVNSKRLSRTVVPIQPVGRSTIPQRTLAKPFQATSVGPLKCLRCFFPLGRVIAG